MRELKKHIETLKKITEGTEMGEIGNVQIDQYAGPDGLMVQLTPINGERHVQMDKSDAQKVAQRLMKWSSSKERAMPGEYESVEEAVGDSAEPIWDLIEELGSHSIVLEELIRYLDGDTIKDFVEDFRRHNDMKKEESVKEADPEDRYFTNKKGEKVDRYPGLDSTKNKVINYNKPIDLAGDSIWQGEKRGEEVTAKVNVGKIKVSSGGEYEDGYISVHVEHDGPWTVYTDTGFEEEISAIVGTNLSWSEQGMQDDGVAHLEGEADDVREQEHTMEELDRILKIAGLAKAPVAEEEKLEEKVEMCPEACCGKPVTECTCGPDCEHCDCHAKNNANESIEEAKKELDEEPNEGNEFAHELKKARDAGKDEFEVDGKKYKVKNESEETDEEVVAEAPTMDTTQLINLLKNAGLSEEAISEKLNEWANSPADAGEPDPAVHGDAYDFAQMVNLSLKRYLDAQDMKVKVNEDHTAEGMKEAYKNFKNK